MWFSALLLSYLFHAAPSLLALLLLLWPAHVMARFCEGGHICSLPRECCTQGCCPPYQGGPRQLPPPSEHVLNLFFISHWFFWCVVVAIILAILCAYSLWKKRRTLCGWGFNEHHTQSEGDSAGSCYAPPQYSRCNSFHHPPPPYTEVTSKPDLYPLVFTCNSDNGKGNGSSYLMVQYFRNYIVRPAGSLSAASTVDSLSSSFICNANEANTLVPPPYSRAASPDLAAHYAHAHAQHAQQAQQVTPLHQHHHQHPLHLQQHMPRSASQLMCHNQPRAAHYATVAINGGSSGQYNTRLHASESGHFSPDESGGESSRSGSASMAQPPHGGEQHRMHSYMAHNSSSSLSDIFVSHQGVAEMAELNGMNGMGAISMDAASLPSLALPVGGTPAVFSNGCIKANPLHRVHTNPTQFANELSTSMGLDQAAVYNSCSSMSGLSRLSVPLATGHEEQRDLQLLRRSLETCCQLLQQQQQQQQPTALPLQPGGEGTGTTAAAAAAATAALRSCSYVTSGSVSGVSSLANIGTPSSPPQATSPTGEVREILDQIRQLQAGVSYEELLLCNASTADSHDADGGAVAVTNAAGAGKARLQQTMSTPTSASASAASGLSAATGAYTAAMGSKSKKFYSSLKPNKALYIPMVSLAGNSAAGGGCGSSTGAGSRCVLKSPVSSVVSGASFFVNRGRARKGWISRSAPTTPGTGLPPNRLGDDSPLLNEHDEDAEGEQNAELE